MCQNLDELSMGRSFELLWDRKKMRKKKVFFNLIRNKQVYL